MDQFAYFTIRVRLPTPGAASRVSGVVEDLASGEKHSFQNGEELLRIVGVPGPSDPASLTPRDASG